MIIDFRSHFRRHGQYILHDFRNTGAREQQVRPASEHLKCRLPDNGTSGKSVLMEKIPFLGKRQRTFFRLFQDFLGLGLGHNAASVHRIETACHHGQTHDHEAACQQEDQKGKTDAYSLSPIPLFQGRTRMHDQRIAHGGTGAHIAGAPAAQGKTDQHGHKRNQIGRLPRPVLCEHVPRQSHGNAHGKVCRRHRGIGHELQAVIILPQADFQRTGQVQDPDTAEGAPDSKQRKPRIKSRPDCQHGFQKAHPLLLCAAYARKRKHQKAQNAADKRKARALHHDLAADQGRDKDPPQSRQQRPGPGAPAPIAGQQHAAGAHEHQRIQPPLYFIRAQEIDQMLQFPQEEKARAAQKSFHAFSISGLRHVHSSPFRLKTRLIKSRAASCPAHFLIYL